MREFTAFLIFEARRQALLVGQCLATWLVLLIAHRAVEGSWNFWRGDLDWEVFGVLFAAALAPFLGIWIALRDWVGDRELGLSFWAYSLPTSATGIFLARGVVLFFGVSLYFGASLLLNAGTPTRAGEILSLITVEDGWQIILGGACLILAGGLFASATASRQVHAVGGLLFGALIYAAFVQWALLSPSVEQTDLWRWDLSGRLVLIHTVLMFAGLVVGAWSAVRRAPDDASRVRRGLLGAAPLLGAACVVLALITVHPVRFGAKEIAKSFSLQDGTTIELVRTAAMKDGHYVARRRQGERLTLLADAVENIDLQAVETSPDRVVLRHGVHAVRRAVGEPRSPWWIRLGVSRQGEMQIRRYEIKEDSP